MRLWHQKLLSLLPRPQLLGQHRECCALRGGGWMKPHATVNYVFRHPFEYLVQYHMVVIEEMTKRGYQVAPEWRDLCYRGKRTPPTAIEPDHFSKTEPIYPEHNSEYLKECIDNLRTKGIDLEIEGQGY